MKQEKSTDLRDKVNETVEWLALYGKTKKNGVTRLLYSDDWLAAQKALEERMIEGGLSPYFDDVGNLYGRLSGSLENAPTILTGSHIDTVVDGGKYDGAYGVIAGLIALQYLRENYGTPKKNIEVVSLCEEEGSRFPMTFWGSGSITGIKSLEETTYMKDTQGISFTDAMQKAGFGKGNFQDPKRSDLESFIELHIEQGEILERENKQIGIVSHIVGQRRYEVTVSGESNHAGTTPMAWRKDALYVASKLIQLLIDTAEETDPGLVATVGQLTLEPNISNVIPGEVVFSIDIRHRNEEVLAKFTEKVFKEFQLVSDHHNTKLSITNWMNEKPIPLSKNLNRITEEILIEDQISFARMVSGAGHDSQIFASFCPTLLLFVPSQSGISHSPFEFTKTEDLEKGIQLLIKILYKLAY